MRLIDADALKEKMKCTNRYFNIKFDIDESPTIDPETLPIVRELREHLAKVTAERDSLKSDSPVKVDSDAFELAARLAEVTAERDGLNKDVRPVVRGWWEAVRDPYGNLEGWIHKECGRTTKEASAYCPTCGADMRGDPK